jgi:hypothetical protein
MRAVGKKGMLLDVYLLKGRGVIGQYSPNSKRIAAPSRTR